MGKSRLAALVLAVVIAATGLMRTATASHSESHHAFSGGANFKGLVVKTDHAEQLIISEAPAWTTLDSRGFQIAPGESQLIVVDFSAETRCDGSEGHCSARVLVGRTLAGATQLQPAAGAQFGLDQVGGASGGHSMIRSLCVRNATGSPASVSVWLEVTRVGSSDFVVDDWTFQISRNAPCSPFVDI